jgi:hypothetical protein
MIPRRSPTMLRGLVCMTDFLFAVIAGLLFLTIQISQEAQARRGKGASPPESQKAAASPDARLRAIEDSARVMTGDLDLLRGALAKRGMGMSMSNQPADPPVPPDPGGR